MLFITFWLGIAAHKNRMAALFQYCLAVTGIGCKIWNWLVAPLPDYHTFSIPDGPIWSIIMTYDSILDCMVLYGPVWFCLLLHCPYGPVWPWVAPYDPLWPCIMTYCHILSHSVLYSPSCSSMVLFNPFCPLWSLIVSYGPNWFHLVPFDLDWPPLIPIIPISCISCMVPYGPILFCIFTYGHIWSFLVQYGPVWSSMVVYGPV